MEIKKYSVCRACTIPREGRLEDYWAQLKALIGEASPALFEKIANLKSSSLEGRTRISVERYFNRAKFRPVPYGRFCTVGLLPWFGDSGAEPMLATDTTVIHLEDWSRAKGLASEVGGAVWAEELCWRVQSTLYTVQGVHYFFQATEDQTELFSLEGFPELDHLLDFCRQERSTRELRSFAGEDWYIYRELMAQLLELQVLMNSSLPNLTGQDYFGRLDGKEDAALGTDGYAIAFRHAEQGFCDSLLQRELLTYISFAQQNIPSPPLADLSAFAQAFSRRYENQWQPLSMVLDPDKGLGYAGVCNLKNKDMEVLLPKRQLEAPQIILDGLSRFLLNGMINGGGKAIDLKGFVSKENESTVLPNTLSVLLQPAGNRQWALEHIGGPSATTLLGRFGSDDMIGTFAGSLAAFEAQANPGVKFFDIAYQTGERTDNINRRPQLYEMELVLGGWSTHPCQLQLSDIFINVADGEVLLYSKQHQCRVVPKMASAYNILRSSHPLLRLLADLQYQGVHHQLLPDLSQRFPGMDYYPALKFGKLLLQPARWKVPASAKKSLALLEDWLLKAQVSRWVRAGRADQYLCLDIERETDRQLLLDSLSRETNMDYICEWAAGGAKGMVDGAGQRFAYQLQLVLGHNREIYAPINSFEPPNDFSSWKIGGKWLYLSLYTATQHQPLVLSELVGPLVSKYAQLIEDWFYILYGDPEKHIRLRIRWKAGVQDGARWALMGEVGSWLGSYGIRDTVIRAYAPEWQRYGALTMELAERFFGLDSVSALEEMKMDEEQRLSCCYGWIWGMVSAAFELEEQGQFLEKMAKMFASEMNWNHVVFKAMNQSWRVIGEPGLSAFPKEELLSAWERVSRLASQEKSEQLLADFIHMHVNRRFPEYARVREAQLYQYLLLHWKRVARSIQGLSVAAR
ncbi:thiopeptide-type bacteriocin biosynthesis protein [Pedobacter sp.]|uniref:thiopeptide-type bacteriocin biosynthesis protein n=1 Tax=Pedobacter sp. TaxID=1411316 RepID=UPI0031D838B9